MKVIKNINNNIALCVDGNGKEMIAFGKGIGFEKPPYEISLDRIERTFYDLKEIDFKLIQDIPPSVFKASMKIVDHLENYLGMPLIATAALALADHINFAIQRKEKDISLNLALGEDIKHLYPNEMKYALYALAIIEEETGVKLDDSEASTIALHFINSQMKPEMNDQVIGSNILDESIYIIENEFHIKIQKNSFNYARFATHMEYLLQRSLQETQIKSNNVSIFQELVNKYPNAYQCALAIDVLFHKRLHITLSDEEKLYLILHINRLCSREM